MQSRQKRSFPVIDWPSWHSLPPFDSLPYEHVGTGVLQVESRLQRRFLRSDRHPESIGEMLQAFTPGLRRFYQAMGLASAMDAIALDSSGIHEEYAHYRVLEPDVSRLTLKALQGLLGQQNLPALAKVLGKDTLLSLQNLRLIHEVTDSDPGKAEMQIMDQAIQESGLSGGWMHSSGRTWERSVLLFRGLPRQAGESQKFMTPEVAALRRKLARETGFDSYAQLALRRWGILDERPADTAESRSFLLRYLVPAALAWRSSQAGMAGVNTPDLYPDALSTCALPQTLPQPEYEVDLRELEVMWGPKSDPDFQPAPGSPYSQKLLHIVREELGGFEPDFLTALQRAGYIQTAASDDLARALWLPESGLPFCASPAAKDCGSLMHGLSLLGHLLSLVCTRESQTLALPYPARDLQSAKALSFTAYMLNKLGPLFEDEESYDICRQNIIARLLHEIIYCSFLDEFQDALYADELSEAAINEAWLSGLSRWYPDLADSHEWLLNASGRWMYHSSLLLQPYLGTPEAMARLTALQVWDMSQSDRPGAAASWFTLASGRDGSDSADSGSSRSGSLSERSALARLWPVYSRDTAKRLAFQLARALDL